MFIDAIKKYLKLILAVALLIAAAFAVGRYTKPDKVVVDKVEVKVRDEEYTRQQVASAKAQWDRDSHSVSTTTSTVIKPCPPPTTDAYTCKPPCATDCSKCPSQVVSSTTTTTTDTHEHGTSSSNTATNEHGTSHETDTTHTTTTTTNNEGLKNWSLSLIASGALSDGKKLGFTPTYGAAFGYKLIGPLSTSVSVFTDKNLIAGLNLGLGKNWSVSAEAGSKFAPIKPFYGGTVGYRLLGPVWLGVWGYSDKSFGLSASFTVK